MATGTGLLVGLGAVSACSAVYQPPETDGDCANANTQPNENVTLNKINCKILVGFFISTFHDRDARRDLQIRSFPQRLPAVIYPIWRSLLTGQIDSRVIGQLASVERQSETPDAGILRPCWPVQTKQLVQIVRKYIEGHPENSNERAVVLVWTALSQAFPCFAVKHRETKPAPNQRRRRFIAGRPSGFSVRIWESPRSTHRRIR